ncbi:cytosolic non-specific dipeptidase-like isoform X2 [Alosa sapidissima]|uniref:cytosolic non-specific dipeptidase-like isoform X2 n=1 Tax=Alosa sapidissima TaxID=34773 RepID=UPI001C0942B2|nr:cytosolic non-specific dipeptidase-like isoform X2 [Alosa sapidissima]
MMEMAAKDIEKLGGTVELVDIGKQELADGQEIPLPPIILGRLGSDPGKKTVCIYGHLDVQPANIDDGWDTEPFKLVEKDGKLYGRGSTDDKGPVLAWFNCIEAYQKTKQTQLGLKQPRTPFFTLQISSLLQWMLSRFTTPADWQRHPHWDWGIHSLPLRTKPSSHTQLSTHGLLHLDGA